MATVEVIKSAGSGYDIEFISWSPIQLIQELGVAQLKIYFAVDNNTNPWTELYRPSWIHTLSNASTVSLKYATYTGPSNEQIPAYLDPVIHKLKLVRVTSTSLYTTFVDGAKLSGRDLNVVNTQALHLLEEEAARLDGEDADIYSFISASLNNYYNKTEIDQFFDAQTIVPAWQNGEDYSEGAVVIHDDPFTASNEVLIWYCTADHTANNGLQPSESGPGSSYWSLSQNSNILENLNYIRKFPGLDSSGLKWNTIEIKNKLAHGLAMYPNSLQSVDSFVIYDNAKQPAFQFTGSNQLILNTGSKLWTKGSAYLAGSNWLNYVPTDTVSNSPVLSVKGRASNSAFEVVKSTASTNTSNVLFKIDDNSLFTDAASHYIDGGTVEFINKLVWFSNAETQNCYGTAILDGNGEPAFTEVRFGRDAKFGTLASCSSPFVPTLSLSASTGNIGTTGTITTSNTITGYDVVVENVQSADYLKTDATGQIIAGVGSPVTNHVAWQVTGSNTSLSNRDVVYLNNATGLWTKAQANNPATLGIGMINGLSGSSGNQSFSVVFIGAVSGFTNLEIGNWYWLSDTVAGEITSTSPSGSGALVDPIGVAVNATTLFVTPARASKLPIV